LPALLVALIALWPNDLSNQPPSKADIQSLLAASSPSRMRPGVLTTERRSSWDPGSRSAKFGYFTIGATKRDVLAVEGKPASFTRQEWKYGPSAVYFNKGRVIGWDIWPGFPLKVRLLPSGTAARNSPGYFTVGSSKDEVLAAQGTPTAFSKTQWIYGSSSVRFVDGRVVDWDVWPGFPLQARRVRPAAAPAPEFFAVGSNKDEVIAVQGAPTQFDDREWKYGSSSVFFQQGLVTGWDAEPGFPLKVRVSKR
jgi:hypothetical protein